MPVRMHRSASKRIRCARRGRARRWYESACRPFAVRTSIHGAAIDPIRVPACSATKSSAISWPSAPGWSVTCAAKRWRPVTALRGASISSRAATISPRCSTCRRNRGASTSTGIWPSRPSPTTTAASANTAISCRVPGFCACRLNSAMRRPRRSTAAWQR